ncbi:uncharacterized protein LOC132742624 [Ruditapes philippinarum]|uniref:uncharacterized protein LOC132742624 n=1 Tax=Ruditapes philippinarum TaxID=129788 RepID=UPI00295B4127|nr:uncharacterized protein LOC132742624 [Ruditapes philippinarum]
MDLTPFLLLATLFTIVQCFHTRNTYEQSQPEGMDEAIMRGNVKKRLHDTDISVPEINNIINDQTLEPFLSYSLQEKLLRSPFTLDRQKRQAKLDSERLKRILSTKKGRKMAEKLSRRKALLRMIHRRRKLRKQRKLSKGKTKEENEPPKPTVSTEESAGQQNNPSSTNEINLTVQVDMNNPPKAINTNKSRSSLPQGNNNQSSSPSLEGLHQDYPITSQKVQAPPDTNIFGVMPNMNSPFRTRTVPDIYRESSRMYPSLPGLISGQSVMKNKAFVNPAFPKPLLDAGHYGNFPNRILPLFDNQQATLLQEGTRHEISAGEQKFEDGDDKKDKRVYDQTNPDNQREANLDFGHTQPKRNHDESNAPPENVHMNGEIKNLLQDIKDILNTRQPAEIKNDNDMVRQEDEQKMENHSDMNNSVEIQSDSSFLSPVVQKEDANILDTAADTENKQPDVPKMQQYDQIGTDVIASFTENSDDELNKEEVIHNTSDLVPNPNISTVILKDPNAKYEEKLLGMSTEDIIKTLQNLNLITKREKKIIQRMAKRWNSDDNFQNMLDQLMRRRYFRKSLRKVLDRAGVSTDDKLSGHDLIIQLLRAEDILIPVEQHHFDSFENFRIQDENIARFKDNKAFPGDNEHIFDNHPGINFPFNKQTRKHQF